MKDWEEIIRDKVDEPSGNLPESVFEEFHARLEASRSAAGGQAGSQPARHRPLLWAIAPAAAAVLAAVLLLRQPSAPEDIIQVVQQPEAPLAVAAEPTEPAGPLTQTIAVEPVSESAAPVDNKKPASSAQATESIISAGSAEDLGGTDRYDTPAVQEPVETSKPENQPHNPVSDPVFPTVSPYKPDAVAAKPVTMKFAPAAGIVAGGGLLAAAVASLFSSVPATGIHQVLPGETFDTVGPISDYYSSVNCNHHHALFKGGLSVGIPVTDRLKIVTGLEYSQYRSSFESSLNSVKARDQLVRYLGVPVRLDWSLAKGDMLDVYVGAGAQADYCIGAMISGGRDGQLHPIENIKKDGLVFSLLAAGGIQVNVNKRMGLYLEPELVWTGGKPSDAERESIYLMIIDGYLSPTAEINRPLTYRTEHPVMFSVSTGLRINLGK